MPEKITRPYWYILHIPTGKILSYHQKNFNKKHWNSWGKSKPDCYAAKVDLCSMGITSGDSYYLNWNCYSVTGKYFSRLVDTRKNKAEFHFRDKVEARDFLRDFILVQLKKSYRDHYIHALCQRQFQSFPQESEFLIMGSNGF